MKSMTGQETRLKRQEKMEVSMVPNPTQLRRSLRVPSYNRFAKYFDLAAMMAFTKRWPVAQGAGGSCELVSLVIGGASQPEEAVRRILKGRCFDTPALVGCGRQHTTSVLPSLT